MKKGQKVRILRDNTIGTIADCTFFKLNGIRNIRYQVQKRGEKEGRWYPAEEISSVIEHCKITSEGENGQVVYANITFNHERSEAKINITSDNPKNLKEHNGYHMRVLLFMLQGMNAKVLESSAE